MRKNRREERKNEWLIADRQLSVHNQQDFCWGEYLTRDTSEELTDYTDLAIR